MNPVERRRSFSPRFFQKRSRARRYEGLKNTTGCCGLIGWRAWRAVSAYLVFVMKAKAGRMRCAFPYTLTRFTRGPVSFFRCLKLHTHNKYTTLRTTITQKLLNEISFLFYLNLYIHSDCTLTSFIVALFAHLWLHNFCTLLTNQYSVIVCVSVWLCACACLCVRACVHSLLLYLTGVYGHQMCHHTNITVINRSQIKPDKHKHSVSRWRRWESRILWDVFTLWQSLHCQSLVRSCCSAESPRCPPQHTDPNQQTSTENPTQHTYITPNTNTTHTHTHVHVFDIDTHKPQATSCEVLCQPCVWVSCWFRKESFDWRPCCVWWGIMFLWHYSWTWVWSCQKHTKHTLHLLSCLSFWWEEKIPIMHQHRPEDSTHSSWIINHK